MSNYTHQTAPTQFVEAAGIRFAYRRFGVKKLDALGFSIGGLIAQQFTMDRPDLSENSSSLALAQEVAKGWHR